MTAEASVFHEKPSLVVRIRRVISGQQGWFSRNGERVKVSEETKPVEGETEKVSMGSHG